MLIRPGKMFFRFSIQCVENLWRSKRKTYVCSRWSFSYQIGCCLYFVNSVNPYSLLSFFYFLFVDSFNHLFCPNQSPFTPDQSPYQSPFVRISHPVSHLFVRISHPVSHLFVRISHPISHLLARISYLISHLIFCGKTFFISLYRNNFSENYLSCYTL